MSASAASASGSSEGEMLDQYRIVSAIGHGAYSEVYLAEDPAGRRVVLKCPHEAIMGDVSTFDRFRRELEIARRLEHPGIQRSLDAGEQRSKPYLVMEYVDGETLRHVLDRDKRLPLDRAIDFASQLADAMAYAHSQGVYHRDLKPENILITPDGRLVVTDFGVALMTGARRLTWRWFSTALGTPDYMAPEQIQGKRGDARTDVYAMGIILFELLAGKVPWEGDNPLSVMSQHLNVPVPPLHQINSAVPPPIEGIVRKAVRKNPDERYQDAGSMLHDLRNWHDLDLSGFLFGDESAVQTHPNRQLIILIAGVSLGFLAASVLFILISYLVVHAH